MRKGPYLKGRLGFIGLPALVQLLSHLSRTVQIELSAPGKQGWIILEQGKLHSARAGGQAGEFALLTMLGWRNCTFQVEPSSTRQAAELEVSWNQVLLRKLRENRSIQDSGRHRETSLLETHLSDWFSEIEATFGKLPSEKRALKRPFAFLSDMLQWLNKTLKSLFSGHLPALTNEDLALALKKIQLTEPFAFFLEAEKGELSIKNWASCFKAFDARNPEHQFLIATLFQSLLAILEELFQRVLGLLEEESRKEWARMMNLFQKLPERQYPSFSSALESDS